MESIQVTTERSDGLVEFLQLNDFIVTELEGNILQVVRGEELPVYLYQNNNSLHFEVDLGNISGIASKELYEALLDANTTVQPVCFALSSSNPEDPRLIITESQFTQDLCDQEILGIFDALELAADTAETILSPFLQNA
ncbi:MAG: hypothetical protein ACPGN3_07130 [Opitutales bacterium]